MKFVVKNKKYVEDGNYFSYNKDALGEAAGKLSLHALRAYLYFIHNKNDVEWTYNSTAYKNWLKMSLHSADTGFKGNSGIGKLIECGYLREVAEDEYEFSEFPRQDWIEETKKQAAAKKVMVKKEDSLAEWANMF